MRVGREGNGTMEERANGVADRRERGTAVRRAVLGDAHVDRAESGRTRFDASFQDLITEGAWGTVWASDAITRRERSMLTLALLAALGNFDELPMHLRACARTGATRSDVAEAFLHVAVYAGVPRANRAHAVARAVFAEMDAESGAGAGEGGADAPGATDAPGSTDAVEAEMREEDA